MSAIGTGETVRDGQPVPEEEVARGGPEVMSFEAQAAETAEFGPKGGRRRTTGEMPVTREVGQTFQARTAETVTLPPPHWENLAEVPTETGPLLETEPQTPPDGPRELQAETPAPTSSAAGDGPEPTAEGPEAEPEAEAAPETAVPIETESPAPPGDHIDPNPETLTPSANMVAGEPGPATEGPEAELEKES